MGSHFQIRPARHSDQRGMHAVEEASFGSPWEEAAFVVSEALIWLVAESENEIVGFALGQVVLDEAEVLNIAVHPDSRSSGIGRDLLFELTRRMAQSAVQNVYLDVRESNEPAVRLYRKCGFEIVGSRTDYYSKPTENALQMKLFLSPDPGPQK